MVNVFGIPDEMFYWIVLPIIIFIARLVDETIGTLRIIFLGRGRTIIAPLLGFFEVLLWLLIISRVLTDSSNVYYYIAYSAGFAFGSLVGMLIEKKLALGIVLIRIITRKKPLKFEEALKKNNIEFTGVETKDIDGFGNIIHIIALRKQVDKIISIVKKFNPKAFFTIEDLQYVNEGNHPLKQLHSCNSRRIKRNK
ncbi:MAG: DUF5698 domain-containing protein [Candidatus Gracilibacteria bacterium]|jgi:uncharacterized protein YebE (UPF0316 family)